MEQITKKLKVALICGYTNHKTRANLHLKSNEGLFKLLIKTLRLPSRVGEFRDTTPWIENIIYAFQQRDDIELHIIAPQIRLRGRVQSFTMDGVNYHYYSTEFSSLLRIINNFKLWSILQTNSRRINRIIKGINPHLVVLSGSENPASSISALHIHDYPIFILLQAIYSDPAREKTGKYNKLIWDMERKIFQANQYFGVYSNLHYQMLKGIAPHVMIMDFKYPRMPKPIIPDVPKTIDFINFAFELSEGKGAHDSIKALAIVKEKHPNVTLNLSGGCSESTMAELKILVSQLGLEDNVSFTPFFEKQEDMFLHMKSARFAVLPIKYDNISGTVYQAMRYGLPVVTNIRPGTLKVNEEGQCLMLSESGNVRMLAEKMSDLIEDKAIAERLKQNSHQYLQNRDSRVDCSGDRLVQDFRAVVNNFMNGTPISDKLLCTDKSFL